MTPSIDHFNAAAATWDDNPQRAARARDVAHAILKDAKLSPTQTILDYGCGTAILGLLLRPHVKRVIAADNAPGMLDALRTKLQQQEISGVDPLLLDLENDPPPSLHADHIVNLLCLHHIADLSPVLNGLYTILNPGGSINIADLETEDGSFHAHVEGGVPHNGFDPAELATLLEAAGFMAPRSQRVSALHRDFPNGTTRDYPLFLLTATKPITATD